MCAPSIWKTPYIQIRYVPESCALYASLMLFILFKCCFSKSNPTTPIVFCEKNVWKGIQFLSSNTTFDYFSPCPPIIITKVWNLFLRRGATDHYYYHSHLYFMLCFAHLFCDITQIIIKIRIIKLLCGENSELQLLLLFVFHFLSHPLFVSTVFFGIIWESTLMWTSIMHCDF